MKIGQHSSRCPISSYPFRCSRPCGPSTSQPACADDENRRQQRSEAECTHTFEYQVHESHNHAQDQSMKLDIRSDKTCQPSCSPKGKQHYSNRAKPGSVLVGELLDHCLVWRAPHLEGKIRSVGGDDEEDEDKTGAIHRQRGPCDTPPSNLRKLVSHNNKLLSLVNHAYAETG